MRRTTSDALFQHPWFGVWQQKIRDAVLEVGMLDRALLTNPSLAGVLAKIVERHEVTIVELSGEVTAQRRSATRSAPDGFGSAVNVNQTWLDVSIPFVGDPETLKYAPSRLAMPPRPMKIHGNALVLSVLDDASADQVVQNVRQIVKGNLDALRSDYEQAKPQLAQAVTQAANERLAKIKAEDERDSTRSFRVIK
jgi:hypothetical protein